MAQLKDLIVTGASRLVGDAFANKLQITTLNAPTTSSGTTYGAGSNNQVLISNGTSVYWGNGALNASSAGYAASAAQATHAASANYSTSAAQATHSASSQYAINAASAGYSASAAQATHAASAQYAISSASAGYSASAAQATHASSAQYAISAASAGYAASAAQATHAASANYSMSAASAGYSTSAAQATHAASAQYAISAASAGYAASAAQATHAASANYSTSAAQATHSASAGYATSAAQATNAASAGFSVTANYSVLNGIEYIVGTQTAATGTWTGVTTSASLYAGKTIAYKLPFAGSGNASLVLTLADGTTASAAVYLNNTRVTTHYAASSVIIMTYDGTNWRSTDYWNSNSRDAGYGSIALSQSTAETAITTNTTAPAAKTYNEKITLAAGNKWVQFAGTNSGTAGSDVLTVGHSLSGATAGNYGDSTAQTPAAGGTFNVPYVSVDAAGHVTGISAHTVTIPAQAGSAGYAASAAQATHSASAGYATSAGNATYAASAGSATDSTKVAKAGDTMSGSLNMTKAGEIGIEVENTTRAHKVAYIVGSSGNGGIYDRTHSKWIIYSTTAGNVVLEGRAGSAGYAASAAQATHAASAAWATSAARAGYAASATQATHSASAGFAASATNARYSASAGYAASAARATYAAKAAITTTANAIAKYSDTAGTFANSGVTIDGSNNVSMPAKLIVTGSTTHTGAVNVVDKTTVAGGLVGTSNLYGATLPASGVEGQVFFQLSEDSLDSRYVNITGDTMTGQLAINVTGTYPIALGPWGGNYGTAGSGHLWYCGTNATQSGYKQNAFYFGDTGNQKIVAGEVWGAVWNDYAEFREADTLEPGRCIKENGNDTLSLTTERLERGCEIISDTFGFAIGETEKAKTPVATTGRVLAYPYESKEEFAAHIGWPVCSGPNGTVSIMTKEEEEKYPSRIIGVISAVPDYDIWHCGGDKDTFIKVNGRVWIRVR